MTFFCSNHAYNRIKKTYFARFSVQYAFVNIQKCRYFVKKLKKRKISRKYIDTKIKLMEFVPKAL